MGFSISYLKFTLQVFITIFWCSGLTLIVLSAMVYREMKSYSNVGEFIQSHYYAPLITLMVMGSIMIVISGFGTLAVQREKQNYIIAFAVLIFSLLICEVTISGIAFLRSNDIETNMREKMEQSFRKYPSDEAVRKSVDAMQRDLKCCGVTRHEEYVAIFFNSSVPLSCCTKDTGYMCSQTWNPNIIHQKACFEALSQFITKEGVILGAVTIGAAFVGIFGIVLAVLLIMELMNTKNAVTTNPIYSGTNDEERVLIYKKGTAEELRSQSEIKEPLSEQQSVAEPEQTDDEQQNLSKPKGQSEQQQSPTEPNANSVQQQSTTEPNETLVQEQSITGPNEISVQQQSTTGPNESSVQQQSTMEPNETSVQQQSTTGPNESSVQQQRTTEPNKNLIEHGNLANPKDN